MSLHDPEDPESEERRQERRHLLAAAPVASIIFGFIATIMNVFVWMRASIASRTDDRAVLVLFLLPFVLVLATVFAVFGAFGRRKVLAIISGLVAAANVVGLLRLKFAISWIGS